MKKAVALFMVLIACVCAVFAAESDDVTIEASVDGETSVAFTASPYTDAKSNLAQVAISTDIILGNITEGPKESIFYASAKTNEAVALEMKLYGTALTLTESETPVDGASIENGNAIELKVEVVTTADDGTIQVVNSGSTDKNKVSFTTAATTTGAQEPVDDQYITFTEGDGVPGKGTRALTWTLRASADGSKAQAGKYKAYLTLDLTSNG